MAADGRVYPWSVTTAKGFAVPLIIHALGHVGSAMGKYFDQETAC
jgi:hypothetical protein